MPKSFDNRYIQKVLLFLAAGSLYSESFLSKKTNKQKKTSPINFRIIFLAPPFLGLTSFPTKHLMIENFPNL